MGSSPPLAQVTSLGAIATRRRLTPARVAQLQRSAGNRSTAALLRKPLKPGVLNVAGETHPDSEPRRVEERRYAKEKINGDYWTEAGFRPEAGFWDKLASRTPKLGDPLLLRVEHLVAKMKSRYIPLLETFSAANVQRWADHPAALAAANAPDEPPPTTSPPGEPNASVSSGQGGASAAVLKALEEYAVAQEAATEIGANWKMVRNQLAKEFQQIQLALELASKDSAEAKDARAGKKLLEMVTDVLDNDLKGALGAAPKLLESSRAVVSEYETKVLRHRVSQDAVIRKRSRTMHKAAEKGAGITGLWKVGDAHITQMLAAAKHRRYEIMSQKEFDADYQPWAAQNR
jgi:hypothetical protein